VERNEGKSDKVTQVSELELDLESRSKSKILAPPISLSESRQSGLGAAGCVWDTFPSLQTLLRMVGGGDEYRFTPPTCKGLGQGPHKMDGHFVLSVPVSGFQDSGLWLPLVQIPDQDVRKALCKRCGTFQDRPERRHRYPSHRVTLVLTAENDLGDPEATHMPHWVSVKRTSGWPGGAQA
jgi:hypothetical protein